MGSAGNGGELCLMNHRVQITFHLLRLQILGWEGLVQSSGGRVGGPRAWSGVTKTPEIREGRMLPKRD